VVLGKHGTLSLRGARSRVREPIDQRTPRTSDRGVRIGRAGAVAKPKAHRSLAWPVALPLVARCISEAVTRSLVIHRGGVAVMRQSSGAAAERDRSVAFDRRQVAVNYHRSSSQPV
jgi:hypothetical protein